MGLEVYRVRGRYYCIGYKQTTAHPKILGKEIINSIPVKKELFDEWKKEAIAFYTAEEKRIITLARECTHKGKSIPREYWGNNYIRKPTRKKPEHSKMAHWIYTIDLDEDKFTITGPDDTEKGYSVREFRLNNIPRHLFRRSRYTDILNRFGEKLYPAMVDKFQGRYSFRTPCLPELDQRLLQVYEGTMHGSQLEVTCEGNSLTPWHSVQLLVLRNFVERFIQSFIALWDLKGDLRTNHTYLQLAYGILCITRGNNNFSFHQKSRTHRYMAQLGPPDTATPTWDPPNSSWIYSLDGILITLEPQISDLNYLQAAIAAVIENANETDTTGLIFSMTKIVIVKVSKTEHGLVESHTKVLHLLPEALMSSRFEGTLSVETLITDGILALLHLHVPTNYALMPQFYPILPAEVCENIMRQCDPSTQISLTSSCRWFRNVSKAFPRLGLWTLVKSYGGTDFLAVFSKSGKTENICVRPCSRLNIGVGVALQTGEIEMMPLRASKMMKAKE